MKFSKRDVLLALGAAVPAAFVVDPVKEGGSYLWRKFFSRDPFDGVKNSFGEEGAVQRHRCQGLPNYRALAG